MTDAKSTQASGQATEAAGRASDPQNAGAAGAPGAESAAAEREAAEAERKLGRSLAIGLPAVVIGGAIVVAVLTSPGPALLVLAAGAILGAIALIWASLRTLGGDAPLAEDMEALAVRSTAADLANRKQAALRALKDLKHEHDIGKIDDADYRVLESKYRAEAKELLRELDTEIEPYRERAEALARKHLVKVGLAEEPTLVTGKKRDGAEDDGAPLSEPKPQPERKPCPKCATLNDPDAAFCKKCGTAMMPPPEEKTDAPNEEKHA